MEHGMAESEDNKRLRQIPSVSEVVEACAKENWTAEYSRESVVGAVREVLAELRSGSWSAVPKASELAGRVQAKLSLSQSYSLKRVVNATGIIVHTNLGRAPLSDEAMQHVREVSGYSNLEFDLEAGERGSREKHAEKFLLQLLPAAEGSLVVNNNAAALLLILNTLAEGKEVVVSRGELIEIGGSFRLPEIMRKSGALLREVGTTNKTRLQDFETALNERTGMILSVHPSNYRIIGFTEKATVSELAALARRHSIPMVEDQGSGILVDLEAFGIAEEPTAQKQFQENPDLVCFSGDKILGGPQAGIICGKKTYIDQLKKNPMFRALRVDKMVYAALEATLALYARGQSRQVPVIAMLAQTPQQLQERGLSWIAQLRQKLPDMAFELESTSCYVGGGVAPMKELPSFAVSLTHPTVPAQELARRLRSGSLPVVTRVAGERVFFELRTISVVDQETILAALEKIGVE